MSKSKIHRRPDPATPTADLPRPPASTPAEELAAEVITVLLSEHRLSRFLEIVARVTNTKAQLATIGSTQSHLSSAWAAATQQLDSLSQKAYQAGL